MKTHAWHRTTGTWIGFLLAVYGLLKVYFGYATAYWLLASSLVYLVIIVSVTVGYHRLFNHNSFSCSNAWKWVFGLVGCASLNSSPFHWSVVHSAHHKYADTPNDPHDANWKYYFRFKNRTNLKVNASDIRLLREPMHKFFADYSFMIFLTAMGISAAFGINSFLYLFALPVGIFLSVSGINTILAHSNGQAANRWYMEFILPLAGEWIHGKHHDSPKLTRHSSRPEYFDFGGVFIKWIRDDKRTS